MTNKARNTRTTAIRRRRNIVPTPLALVQSELKLVSTAHYIPGDKMIPSCLESRFFEFGYEAVGEVDSRMEIVADWRKQRHTGVIYYLRDNKIRGVMMCNVWDKVEAARQLILRGAGDAERLT